MQCSKKTSLATLITIFLVSTPVTADEEKSKQPDEGFLEFLANMSEQDGEISDPLDMLDISESELSGISSAKKKQKNTFALVNKIVVT